MRLTTADLYESSYLLCEGARLVEAWTDRGRVIFTLEGSEDLGDLQREYHLGRATANLSEYRGHLEGLKDVLFERLRTRDRRNRHENTAELTA